MAKINLLPWREELRKQRQMDFLIFLGIGLFVAVVIMITAKLTVNGMIDHQKARNQYVQNEIKALDKKIKEIKALEKTKARLLARMEVIQQLQSSRPEVVHMFDQLARTVPEGVFLTKFSQSGNKLSIDGNAQSNTRVSAYMRTIEESPWLKGTDLKVIRSRSADSNSFSLKVAQNKVKDTKAGQQ